MLFLLFLTIFIFLNPSPATAQTPSKANGILINEFLTSNASANLDSEFGNYSDWIELYNSENYSINISGFYLTDDLDNSTKWKIPDNTIIEANGFLLFWADGENTGNHTNFKLNSDNGEIGIFNNNALFINEVSYDSQLTDISWGRQPDGTFTSYYFANPTPANANIDGVEEQNIMDTPAFSLQSGFYNGIQSITLSTESATATIRYTTNGDIPTNTSNIYTTPIQVNTTTVIRARVFDTDYLPSPIITQTYFIDEDFNLPVVSLVTDSLNLWDWETGINVMGPNANPDYPHFDANFWQDWEKPAHIEYFNIDGELDLNMDLGIEIFGGYSRAYPKKSFTLRARAKYAQDKIEYNFFNTPIDTFDALVLRASGQDWTHIRNELIYDINKEANTSVGIQAYKHTIVFLNGEYWGLYSIMERKGSEFIESHYGYDDIDILKEHITIVEGDDSHYLSLLDYINSNDMTNNSVLDNIDDMMYIDNFIDAWIYPIYSGRQDNLNLRWWRPRTDEGKWRWIVYDMDGWFLEYNSIHSIASMETAEEVYLHGRLLLNEDFKIKFINRIADYMNTFLLPENVIDMIDNITNNIKTDIPRDIEKWGTTQGYEYHPPPDVYPPATIENWYLIIDWLKGFATTRPDSIKKYIVDEFNLNGTAELTLNISDIDAADVIINTIFVSDSTFKGTYFQGIPVEITLIPKSGYIFTGWSNSDYGDKTIITLNLRDDCELTANFEEGEEDFNLIINEINYNSSDDFNPDDWVELYNPQNSWIDISSCYFSDEDDEHTFIFPDSTLIEPNGYLILCRDKELFHTLFPKVNNYIGDFDFGLSGGGEMIRLYNSYDIIIDSLTYDDEEPWPTEPDGNGPTLELIRTDLDNRLAENWTVSLDNGTPGISNIEVSLPVSIILGQNYPNPFNKETIIPFYFTEDTEFTLYIYNIAGRLVNSYKSRGKWPSGSHYFIWDCKNNSGEIVSSGIYFYNLKVGNYNNTGKMIFLK